MIQLSFRGPPYNAAEDVYTRLFDEESVGP